MPRSEDLRSNEQFVKVSAPREMNHFTSPGTGGAVVEEMLLEARRRILAFVDFSDCPESKD